MFFDSHVHFEFGAGEHGIARLLENAAAAGVQGILAVGGSPALNRLALAAARRFPQTVRAAIGWDRTGTNRACPAGKPVSDWWRERIERCMGIGMPVAAVGEIGLDYHYDRASAAEQKRLMRAQLAAARALALPVVVHSRNAEEDTLALLAEHRGKWRGCAGSGLGVLHCFTGTADFARRLTEMDFYIGFSGIITFANAAALREVAGTVPEERLLIETDTPYLAPAPYRGKRNQPAYLPATAAKLAGIRGISVERIAGITRANALRLFASADSIRADL